METIENLKQVKIVNGVCTAVSVGSSIATPILIARSQNKAREYIEHYELYDLTLKERIKYTWKFYIPPAISLSLGLAANITSGIVSNKLASTLGHNMVDAAISIAAQTETDALFTEKLKEKYGDKTAQGVRDLSAQTIDELREKHNPITFIDSTPEGSVSTQLCDDTHGRYFKGSIEEVKAAVNEVNALITKGQDMSLADVYEFLGLTNGSIDRSLRPAEGELFELDWASSIYEGQPCAHFGFKRLTADVY